MQAFGQYAVTAGSFTVCGTSTVYVTGGGTSPTWSVGGCGNVLISPAGNTCYVTGVTVGSSCTITYTNAGGALVHEIVYVNPYPNPIVGPALVCDATNDTFTDATTGGTWSTTFSNFNWLPTPVAPHTAGTIYTNNPGKSALTYTVLGCAVTDTFMIDTAAATPSGPSTVCVGSSVFWWDRPYNIPSADLGAFSTTSSLVTISTPAVVTNRDTATVSITGVAIGAAPITFTLQNGCFYTAIINVIAGIHGINGSPTICGYHSTTTLADSTAGGTWSTSSTILTTLTTVSGHEVVTSNYSDANTRDTSVIVTYTSGSCTRTMIVTLYPRPNITGATPLCLGSSETLTGTPIGGTWSLSTGSTSIVSISPAGVVTGLGYGTASITYTVASGCYTVAAVSVTPDTVAGNHPLCPGDTMTLRNSGGVGIWTGGTPGVATITSGGFVTAISSGTTVVTYTNTATGCTANAIVVVNPLPHAGTITGTSTTCVGTNTTLVDTAAGGSGAWHSSNTSVASVSGGIVTGLMAGTTVISYSVTNSCGTAVATDTVTILALPNAGSITGTNTGCVGDTLTLVDGAAGGVWCSSNITVATVSGGIVIGAGAGTAIISYSVTNSCGTAVATDTVTIGSVPNAGSISGTNTGCVGDTLTLVDGAAGGVWSSSNITVATVTGGTVIGVGTGTAIISYSVTNSCGTAVATDTVTIGTGGGAGTITGTAPLCIGLTITLADAITGGAWTSSNGTVASVSGGIVTGLAAGTTIISYTVTSGCGTGVATDTITVSSCCLTDTLVINTGYNPLTGSTVTVGSNGGTPSPDPRWNVYDISPDAAAEISNAGNTAVTFGSSADVIDGTTVVGGGSPDTGWVAGVNSEWISCQNDVKYRTYDTGFYSMLLGRPFHMCSDDSVTFDLQIAVDNIIVSDSAYIDGVSNPLLFGLSEASPPTFIQYFGAYTPLKQTVWLSSGEHILYLRVKNYSRYHGAPNPTGLNVYGDIYSADGIASIVRENDTSCHSSCGEERHSLPNTATTIVPVTGSLVCFPNPNGGSFTLRGALPGTTSKEASIEVVDMLGKVVYRDVASIENGGINKTITLGDNIANGVYLIKVINENSSKVIRVSVQR